MGAGTGFGLMPLTGSVLNMGHRPSISFAAFAAATSAPTHPPLNASANAVASAEPPPLTAAALRSNTRGLAGPTGGRMQASGIATAGFRTAGFGALRGNSGMIGAPASSPQAAARSPGAASRTAAASASSAPAPAPAGGAIPSVLNALQAAPRPATEAPALGPLAAGLSVSVGSLRPTRVSSARIDSIVSPAAAAPGSVISLLQALPAAAPAPADLQLELRSPSLRHHRGSVLPSDLASGSVTSSLLSLHPADANDGFAALAAAEQLQAHGDTSAVAPLASDSMPTAAAAAGSGSVNSEPTGKPSLGPSAARRSAAAGGAAAGAAAGARGRSSTGTGASFLTSGRTRASMVSLGSVSELHAFTDTDADAVM